MSSISDKVFITEEVIVEILVVGDQTVGSVRALGDEAFRLANQLKSAGRPALILDNLIAIGTVPPDARNLVVDFIKSKDYDRLAMIGSHPLLRFGANLMFQASGNSKRLKFFDNRQAAVEWLLAVKTENR